MGSDAIEEQSEKREGLPLGIGGPSEAAFLKFGLGVTERLGNPS